jgi:radical SAM protein with 4Fe4S-binding SPASM domain
LQKGSVALTRKATFRFYGDPQKHVPLMSLLPLNTPLSLHIDPSNACNFRCKFCPTGHPDIINDICHSRGLMDFSLFKKIIDDLADFAEPLQRLHLYKDGEPLLNPNFPAMVRYAKDSGVAQSVETTTNALLLSSDMAQELIDTGLDRIRISIKHVSTEGYLCLTKTHVEFEEIVEKVCILHSKVQSLGYGPLIHVNILDTGLSEEEKAHFLYAFENISDEIHIDALMGWNRIDLFDFRLGIRPLSGMNPASPVISRTVCPLPFYSLAINADGIVSACCVDWSHSIVVGDVKSENLLDIWKGDRLRTFRLTQLTGRKRANPVCASCDYVHGLPQTSNLDAYIDRLQIVFSERSV